MSVENVSPIKLDVYFQMSLLKLMIEEDYFCSQMSKYLGDDPDLKNYIIFDSKAFQNLFIVISSSFQENGIRPSLGQIRQKLLLAPEKETKDTASRDSLIELVDKIVEIKINDDYYYRKAVETFIKRIKFIKGMKKVSKLFQNEGSLSNSDGAQSSLEKANAELQVVLDNINQVSFDKEDIITLDENLYQLLSDNSRSMQGMLPTGITELDKDLHGGLPRETLVTVLAGTNVGKSMFCISLGAQVLKAIDPLTGEEYGYKVLYIPLEGMRQEVPLRFAACLAGVEYANIIHNNLSEQDSDKIKKVTEKYGANRLMIKNMMDFNVTIEELVAKTREIYKEFKFDMLIVDYGQLLETQVPTEGHRFTLAKVYRGLAACAREFNCTVISPVQSTRQSQENQNQNFGQNRQEKGRLPVMRSSDISEAYEIARVSGIIISLNMTDDERPQSKLRVFLEKQRHGIKGKTYGLITDYGKCNLITGNFYNAHADIVQGEGILATLGIEEKDEINLKTAIGAGENEDKIRKIEKLNAMINDIEKKDKKISDLRKDINKEKENNPLSIDDEDSFYKDLIAKVGKLNAEIQDIKTDYLNLFSATYPSAHEDNLTTIQTEIESLRKEKQTLKVKDKLEDLLSLEKRFSLWLECKNSQ